MLSTPFLALLTGALAQALAQETPKLERVNVRVAAAKGTEIISVQAGTARAVLLHGKSGAIELLDLADPARPRSVRLIDLDLGKGEEATSVALPPEGDWCLAVAKARRSLEPGRALLHSLADGRRLATFPTGVGPDCVSIARDGKLALVANEAEGFDEVEGKVVSAPGSLTLVRFAEDLASSEVVQIAFDPDATAPADGRRIERNVSEGPRELELGSGPEFFEPEVVAFVPGAARALVTLQENNLVADVDLAAGKVTRLLPLGLTTHAADLLDDRRFDDGATLLARREPDGVALTPDGRFFVTADEGDTEPSIDRTPKGQPASGGRTLGVFDLASGALLGDTGPELDRMAAKAGLHNDKRSLRKGCEPEMVLTLERAGIPYAAVTLERAGALALVDLRDPASPKVVCVAPTGYDLFEDEPEGLAHYRDPKSGDDYLYVANEGTNTLGVLRIPR